MTPFRVFGERGIRTIPTIGVAGGGWTPLHLGLKQFIQSDNVLNASGNPATNGETIATAIDKTGNVNAVQTTDAARPTLVSSVLNGQPTMRFAGSQWLTANAIATLLSGTDKPFTVFCVAKWDTTTGILVPWALSNSGDDKPFVTLYGNAGQWVYGRRDDSNAAKSPPGGTHDIKPHSMIAVNTGTAVDLYIDGGKCISTGDVDLGSTTANSFCVGALLRPSGGQVFKFDGDIYEIGVVNRAINNSEVELLSNYHVVRYGLTFAVMFGDSITAGTGASDAAHRWVNILSSARSFGGFQNAGLSGTILQNTVQNTVAVLGGAANNNGRDTYATRVTAYNPTHVYILYGLNDLRLNDAAITSALFQNDLAELVDLLVANGTKLGNIVIGSPPYIPSVSYTNPVYSPWDGGSAIKHASYVAACSSVATTKGTRFADVYQFMAENGGDALIGDGIHPNDAGHSAIAAAFLNVL